MSNVVPIPVWKEGSTPAEFLMECAMVAETKPQMFEKFVIVFDRGNSSMDEVDYYWRGTSTKELIGLLELAKMRLFEETRI